MLPPVFGLIKQPIWSELLQELPYDIPNDWDNHKECNNVNQHIAYPPFFLFEQKLITTSGETGAVIGFRENKKRAVYSHAQDLRTLIIQQIAVIFRAKTVCNGHFVVQFEDCI